MCTLKSHLILQSLTLLILHVLLFFIYLFLHYYFLFSSFGILYYHTVHLVCQVKFKSTAVFILKVIEVIQDILYLPPHSKHDKRCHDKKINLSSLLNVFWDLSKSIKVLLAHLVMFHQKMLVHLFKSPWPRLSQFHMGHIPVMINHHLIHELAPTFQVLGLPLLNFLLQNGMLLFL